jgi:polysaccharide biosynthesis transport protein
MLNHSSDPLFPDGLPDVVALRGAANPPPLPRRKPALPSFPDPISLLKAVKHRWLFALTLGTLAGAVAGGIAWKVMPVPRYTAAAEIEVHAFKPILMSDAAPDRTEFKIFQATQLALVQSALVLNSALGRPGIADLATVKAQPDPEEWLESQLIVEFRAGSEVMRLSLSGEREKDVVALVNAVGEAYLEEVLTKDHTDRSANTSTLKVMLDEYSERLTRRRTELKKLAEKIGSDDKQTLALKQQFAVQHLAQEKTELQKVQLELKRTRSELEVYWATREDESPRALDESVVAEALSRDLMVDRLRVQVDKLDSQIRQTARIIRNKSDPALRDLQMRRAAAREKLQARLDELRGQRGDPRAEKLDELDKQVKILTQYEKMLVDGINRLEHEAQNFNHEAIDLQWMKDEVTQWEETSRQLGKQYEALNVELKAPQRGRWTVRAEHPRLESSKKRLATLGMAILAAFGGTVFGLSWREYRYRRVDSPEELVEDLGLRLVGTLPALPPPNRGRSRVPPPDAARFQSLLIESVDAARTVVLRDCQVGDLRSVMITSASKGEGKSSLASHLAISVARTGRRVLLADFDFRSPSAHRLFDIAPGPGIAELLRGEADLDEVVYTVTPDLDVAPAGNCDAQALRALGQGALPELIARMKSRYDFVVIDSAPLLPVADSLLVSQHADAVILSVFREVSRLPAVFAGHARLAALGVRVLGVVVTGVAVQSYGQSYPYAPAASQ